MKNLIPYWMGRTLFFLTIFAIVFACFYKLTGSYLKSKSLRWKVKHEIAKSLKVKSGDLSLHASRSLRDGLFGVVYKKVKFRFKDPSYEKKHLALLRKKNHSGTSVKLGVRNILSLEYLKLNLGVSLFPRALNIKLRAKISDKSQVIVHRKIFMNDELKLIKSLPNQSWREPSLTKIKIENIPLSHALLALFQGDFYRGSYVMKFLDGDLTGTLKSFISHDKPTFPLSGEYKGMLTNLHLTEMGKSFLGEQSFKIQDLKFSLRMKDGKLKLKRPIEMITTGGGLRITGYISYSINQKSKRVTLYKQRFRKRLRALHSYPYWHLEISPLENSYLFKKVARRLGCSSQHKNKVVLQGHWDRLSCLESSPIMSLGGTKDQKPRSYQ